jgi:polar amino acid transport system ATP-binding protein
VTRSEGSSAAAAVPAADTAPVLEVIGISKSNGSHEVLRDGSLTLRGGEGVCLIDPSGAGKSTFLWTLNRLEEPDAGEVWVGGQPMGFEQRDGKLHELSERKLSARRAKTALAFQRFNLFHEIAFVREVTERIVFMADAGIVEEGTVEQVIGTPREPRTRQFLQRVLA